ncbi:hypothetical protein AA313_de0200847 [Arthrobotrys entomopaga]|nr:hypothetical protein AA313_de0200847 [Arthrobotrys entomopaga]
MPPLSFTILISTLLITPIIAPPPTKNADKVLIPIFPTFKDYRSSQAPLLDKIDVAQKAFQKARKETCPLGNIHHEKQDVDESQSSYNILRLGLLAVSSKLASAIRLNRPETVSLASVEEAKTIKNRLDGFTSLIIALQQDLSAAYDELDANNIYNGFQYLKWVWMCKAKDEPPGYFCDPLGKAKRLASMKKAYDAAPDAPEILRDAVGWVLNNNLDQNESFNKILGYYNPESTVHMVHYPRFPGVDYGGLEGKTVPWVNVKKFNLGKLFERLDEWFGCWRGPLGELMVLTEGIGDLPVPPTTTTPSTTADDVIGTGTTVDEGWLWPSGGVSAPLQSLV